MKLKLKLFLISLSALFAMCGCSAMSDTWDWFFDDDETVEIVAEGEMDEEFDEGFDEEFDDEFDDEFGEGFDEEFSDEFGEGFDEEFGDEFGEGFDEEFGDEFDEGFDEEFGDEFDEEFGEEYGDEPMQSASSVSLPRAVVYFDYKSIVVPATSLNLLQLHAQYLIDSGASVTVVGHSDSIASSRYNKEFAFKRAQAVAKILVQMGVSPSNIGTESRGEEELAVEGNSPYANAMNRRVELHYNQ